MIKDTRLNNFCLPSNATIKEALQFLSEKKNRIAFVVDQYDHLLGSMTDGDFRRWIMATDSPQMNTSVLEIANKQVTSLLDSSDDNRIAEKLSQRITHIPLVNKDRKLTAIAYVGTPIISIGNHTISNEASAYLIAEIGNNHNGSFTLAIKLVDEAIASGANAVKFQMRDMATLYGTASSNKDNQDLGSQYILDLLERFQLSDNEMFDLFDYVKSKGLDVICTPFDTTSAKKLHRYGKLDAFKVASADLTNHELMIQLSEFGLPLIVSTGMATETEIANAVEVLKNSSADFILLHCNSTYPTPYSDINLAYIERLQELSGRPVGYSGHERGIAVPIAAVARGAKVIEKHFTLDQEMEGNDHKVSLLPDEFAEMVRSIRAIEQSIGTKKPRSLSQGETINRESLAKSLFSTRSIKQGEKIHPEDITTRSPGNGLPPYRKKDLIGRIANRDIDVDSTFYLSDINGKSETPKSYSFPLPVGLPVRYHDAQAFIDTGVLDFIEFHFSYKDLELDPANYFNKVQDMNFVVHAPELFSGDHVLDLCSTNESYRNRSIVELKRVIQRTIELKKYFKGPKIPCIVVNVGGFSNSDFLTDTEKQLRIKLLKESLSSLRNPEIEIIPQTMPPFPWHFGGQQFHNLFVDQNEILKFCSEMDMRICFDISHSKLACNYYQWNFTEFCEALAPITAHYHIADAKGQDGEGLQVGEGEIDFKSFFHIAEKHSKSVTWLPEIWQGHKDFGQGFWGALNRLQNILSRD